MNPWEKIKIRSLECPGQSVDDWLLDGELQRCAREKLLKNGNNGDQPERYCKCNEMIVNGRRVPCPPGHDCRYVEARSALVFEAAKLATERIGDPLHDTPLGHRWTHEFNKVMDRLSAPLLRQSEP